MKLHVIKDRAGSVIAAMEVGTETPEGDAVEIRPAHDEHKLHTVEVPDEFAKLSAEEFAQRVEKHLAG